MINLEDFCIYISTSKSYEDLIPPMILLLTKYTNLNGLKTYIGSEEPSNLNSLLPETHLSIEIFHCIECGPWGKRTIENLKKVKEKYVLFILDDFFLTNYIDFRIINQIINFLNANSHVGFVKQTYRPKADRDFLSKSDNFTVNFHPPAIWRKDFLIKILRKHESIWAFETMGAKRLRRWYKKNETWIVNRHFYNNLWLDGLSPVLSGRWLQDQKLFDFFESERIHINYSVRGLKTRKEHFETPKYHFFKRHKWFLIPLKIFNRFRSNF